MDILLINDYLKQGKTVKEIREILGYSEKAYQKKIKELGYKYNQKEKQYVLENVEIVKVEPSNTDCSTSCITNNNNPGLMTKEQEQSINFIYEKTREA